VKGKLGSGSVQVAGPATSLRCPGIRSARVGTAPED